MSRLLLAAAAACVATAAGGAVEITHTNFEELTSSKNAFIKFQAPW
jgi:hypothetical protein